MQSGCPPRGERRGRPMSTDTVAKRPQPTRRADGVIDHLSVAERVAIGGSARETVP